MVAGGAAASPFARTFDPVRLPRVQAVENDLKFWLTHFERNPDDRYVSDGDPDTVTVPGARKDRLRADLPKHLKVVERCRPPQAPAPRASPDRRTVPTAPRAPRSSE